MSRVVLVLLTMHPIACATPPAAVVREDGNNQSRREQHDQYAALGYEAAFVELETLVERATQIAKTLEAAGANDPQWERLGETLSRIYMLCSGNSFAVDTEVCHLWRAELDQVLDLKP